MEHCLDCLALIWYIDKPLGAFSVEFSVHFLFGFLQAVISLNCRINCTYNFNFKCRFLDLAISWACSLWYPQGCYCLLPFHLFVSLCNSPGWPGTLLDRPTLNSQEICLPLPLSPGIKAHLARFSLEHLLLIEVIKKKVFLINSYLNC